MAWDFQEGRRLFRQECKAMTERFIELKSMQRTRRCFYQFRSNLHASGKSVVSFDQLDLDGDGIIDRSEFRAAKSRAGVKM